jgi:hypothetical protein
MDFAILQAIVFVLKELVRKIQQGEVNYDAISTNDLAALFLQTVREGDGALIDHPDYLALFGLRGPMSASAVWNHLLQPFWKQHSGEVVHLQQHLLAHGPLARRIQRQWMAASTASERHEIYHTLSGCLGTGKVF